MSQLLWASQICLLRNTDCVNALKCDNTDCLVYFIQKFSESEEEILASLENLIEKNFEFSLKATFEQIHKHCTECESRICPDECVYHNSLLLNHKINWECENEENNTELIFDNFQLDANSFASENFDFVGKMRVFNCEKCRSVHRYDMTTQLVPEHFFVSIEYNHFLISSEVHKILKSIPFTLSSDSLYSNTHESLTYKLSGIIFFFDNSYYSITLNSRRTWESKKLNLSNASLYNILVQVFEQDNLPFQLIYSSRPRGPFRISKVAWDMLSSGICEKILCTMPCGKIQDSLNCSCCQKVHSFKGWNCLCGQLNHSTICICGQFLNKCLTCKYFSLSPQCPYCYQIPDSSENCPICSEPYQENHHICSNCLNPNPAIFN